mmetsp:Transcript_53/g.44  ORF Transcript_53/g.44 Transcript_53/m.44 type:complete len:111 (-) Transcript_53:1760-2092(-)
MAVCSKCIFHSHNGHDLRQLDDVVKQVVTRLQALKTQVDAVVKEQEECKAAMQRNKAEVEALREKQVLLINKRFSELQHKLEERRNQLSGEAVHKFDGAIFKASERIRGA